MPVREAGTPPTAVSRLFIQCDILIISKHYWPPRPVNGISILSLVHINNMSNFLLIDEKY
jgi:hypothetical protein